MRQCYKNHFKLRNCRGRNFRGRNCRGANYRRANCRGANGHEANCRGANCHGANGYGAICRATNSRVIGPIFISSRSPEMGTNIKFRGMVAACTVGASNRFPYLRNVPGVEMS